jgi:hypothetical protein
MDVNKPCGCGGNMKIYCVCSMVDVMEGPDGGCGRSHIEIK